MLHRHWFPTLVTLVCLPASPAWAQLLSDPATLRHTFDVQAEWADSLVLSRQDAVFRFLAVAEEICALPDKAGSERLALLGEAQDLSDLMASLDEDILEATTMVRETKERLVLALESRSASLRQSVGGASQSDRSGLEAQARELEGEVAALQVERREVEADDPLHASVGTLSALARVVEAEHERLRNLRGLQEELRLFLGDLRLFDETAMPPSARSGGGDDPGSGCLPAACAIGGAPPADLPLMHSQPEAPGGGQGLTVMTPASLARLHHQISARVVGRELSARKLADDDKVVRREISFGAGLMAFQDDGSRSSAPAPTAKASLVFSWPLGGSVGLTVEPLVGGRALRVESSVFTELAGEVRETLTGSVRSGRSRWQVTSWQKGRFLSEPLPPPGYLEPGRVEAGLAGRLFFSLDSKWEVDAQGELDGVRYEPEGWRALDRQGLGAALGVAWHGESRSARLSLGASHHGFPHSLADWEERREDTRVGADLSGSLEGKLVASFSLGGSWNQSRIPAYDFQAGRAALVLSVPWGKGSLQGYAALAHQKYSHPGPEDAPVAPSDQDSGSVVSLQYTHPLDSAHGLMVQGGWSRSQTGFRNHFYERLGVSVNLTFRGS